MPVMQPTLCERIDALLPQTQCTRCGYPACRPYAEAIASGQADIDRCPPGGSAGIAALAQLLGRAVMPLDPAHGVEAPPAIAVIDEATCIGCTKCIQACPVDAIVGASKRMHDVIADECTGCELCIAPCPVDCISMQAVAVRPLPRAEVLARATQARGRYTARLTRLDRDARERELERTASRPVQGPGTPADALAAAPISRNAVLEAIARGRARRAQPTRGPGPK